MSSGSSSENGNNTNDDAVVAPDVAASLSVYIMATHKYVKQPMRYHIKMIRGAELIDRNYRHPPPPQHLLSRGDEQEEEELLATTTSSIAEAATSAKKKSGSSMTSFRKYVSLSAPTK